MNQSAEGEARVVVVVVGISALCRSYKLIRATCSFSDVLKMPSIAGLHIHSQDVSPNKKIRPNETGCTAKLRFTARGVIQGV